MRRFTSAPNPVPRVAGSRQGRPRRAPSARSGCRRNGRGSPTPRRAPRCSRWRGHSPCAVDHLHDARAGGLERGDGVPTRARPPAPCPPRSTGGGCPPRRVAAAASSSSGQLRGVVRHRLGSRGRVPRIVAGDRPEQQGHRGRRGRRADLVERGREGDDAVPRHPAVRGAQTHRPGQRRGLSDRAPGVGADGERDLERGHGSRGPPDIAGPATGPTGWPPVPTRSAPWTTPSRTRPCWSCPAPPRRRRPVARRCARRTRPAPSRMRLPAVDGRPFVTTRSLSATGTPSSGGRASSAALPDRRASAKRRSAERAEDTRALRVEGLPGVEAAGLAFDESLMSIQQLHGAQLARPQQAAHLVRAQARRVRAHRRRAWTSSRPRHRGSRAPRGGPRRVRAHRQRLIHREARCDDILSQDGLDLDGLRRGRDAIGVERGQHRVLVEDVVELAMESGDLVLAEAEAREMGDMRDILARQAGHHRRIPCRSARLQRVYPTLTIGIEPA